MGEEKLTFGVQARWGEWCAHDTPERRVHLEVVGEDIVNAYFIEGEEAVFTSLKDYGQRFVFVTIKT